MLPVVRAGIYVLPVVRAAFDVLLVLRAVIHVLPFRRGLSARGMDWRVAFAAWRNLRVADLCVADSACYVFFFTCFVACLACCFFGAAAVYVKLSCVVGFVRASFYVLLIPRASLYVLLMLRVSFYVLLFLRDPCASLTGHTRGNPK